MRTKQRCLWFLFDDLDDWEVNHWLTSNQTSVPQLIETFSLSAGWCKSSDVILLILGLAQAYVKLCETTFP